MHSPAVAPPVHSRDGMRHVPVETWMSAEWAEGAAVHAHTMFRKLAGHLDFMAHILERSGLNVDDLLDGASRAVYPAAMRRRVEEIAERLRAQADLLEGWVWWRGFAPRNVPEDDPVAWRPLNNLTWDAKKMRGMARLIERDVTVPPPPAPRPVHVGDLHLVFRNAINGRTETHFPATLEEAALLARDHRPFNNTGVQLFRVTEIPRGVPHLVEVVIPAVR
ncbi:hypothetical protein SUDANB95_07863 (plasmid) [Actinosynnema sp. ALI-1.44]